MSREIKVEWHDGSTVRKRWLASMPNALGDANLAIREVLIRTDHPRAAPGHYAVTAAIGTTTYWIDAGTEFAAAVSLAEDVLLRGAGVFDGEPR